MCTDEKKKSFEIRDFRRNSILQAVCDTSKARTTIFFLPHEGCIYMYIYISLVEGNKI